MKLKTISTILMIASFLLLLPLFQAPTSITLIQNTPSSIIISVNTPSVHISVSNGFQLFLNISYIDPVSNELLDLEGFWSVVTLEIDIELPNGPGYYLFEMRSSQLTVVEIRQTGLYLGSIIAIIGAVALYALLLIRDYIWIYEV